MTSKSNQTGNCTAIVAQNFTLADDQDKAPIFTLAGNQDKEKPLLLLHIGPPKTATTTLQDGFLEFKGALLERDNIYYCEGKTCQAAAHDTTMCGFNLNLSAADECWSNLRERLQNLPGRPTDSHVLFSAEPMSIGVRRWQHRMNRRAPIDWLSVRDQLGQDWRPVVILGYRRFMDWLPSAEQQIWRWNGAKPNLNKWPKENGGMRIQPLFPTRWKEIVAFGKYTYPATNLLYDNIDGLLPVVLFNMHDLSETFPSFNATAGQEIMSTGEKISMLSRFFCKTFSETGIKSSSSCSESLALDERKKHKKVSNPSQTLYYDVLAVAAYDMQLTPVGASRRRIAVLIEEFQRDLLNQTFHDFPVTCPSRDEDEHLLSYSLHIESQLLPSFHNTSYGKDLHESDFWNNFKRKKYCWIDTDAVLSQDKWKDFFGDLSKSPEKYLPKLVGRAKQKRKARRKKNADA